jgi:hypothetical protein
MLLIAHFGRPIINFRAAGVPVSSYTDCALTGTCWKYPIRISKLVALAFLVKTGDEMDPPEVFEMEATQRRKSSRPNFPANHPLRMARAIRLK